MTNAILRGKSYTGNPQVQFDERKVASAKAKHRSPFYKSELVLASVVALTTTVNAAEYQKVTGDISVTETSTIAGVANPGSVIDVRAGTAVLTSGRGVGYELPADLRDGLGLWLDANVNTTEGSVEIARRYSSDTNTYEGVVEWRDVRETGQQLGEFRYPRAVLGKPTDMWENGDLASIPPTWYTDENEYPGLKFLDFGDFGSGRWMFLADGIGLENGGDQIYKQPVRSFFLVVGFHDTLGHLLGHIPGPNAVNSNPKMFFHKQKGSDGTGAFAAKDSAISNWRRGETRLNGVMIDPVMVTPEKGCKMMLISQIGPEYADIGDGIQTPYFNTLVNHGNLTSARGYTDRQGGAIYGEILIYERILSDVERQRVEAYLMAKWFGKGVAGELRVENGAKASVDGTSPTAIGAATGSGIVEQIGSSTIKVVGNGALETAVYALADGTVSQEEKRAPIYVRPESGKILKVSGGNYSLANGAQAGVFKVIGEDGAKVMLPPGTYDDLTLDIQGAELIVAPRMQPAVVNAPEWTGSNLLVDASFEGLTANDNVKVNTVQSRWTETGAEDHALLGKYTGVWYGVDSTNKFGSHILALQGNSSGCGAVSQTFTAPITGRYRLSYWMARRSSRKEKDGETCLKVLLDGQIVLYNPFRMVGGVWDNELKYNEADMPLLIAGSEHTLTLAINNDCATDRAVVLDMVRIVPEEESMDYIYIPDSGFEQTPWFADAVTNPNGTYKEATASDNWFAWAWNGVGGCGITRNSAWWAFSDGYPGDVARDRQKVYLQKGAAISTRVYIPRTGRLCFSCRYSNRRRSGDYKNAACSASCRKIGHCINVRLDDASLGVLAVEETSRQRCWRSIHAFTGDPGWKTLTIENVMPEGSSEDLCAVVDDITLCYVDDVSDPVGRGVPVARDFDTTESGYYLLRLPVGAYQANPAIVDVSSNWSTYFPTEVKVSVDGMIVGGVYLESGDLKEYVYALPYLTSGKHELKLIGTAISSENAQLRIGKPKFERFETEAGIPSYDLSKVKIRLDENCKLDLRYSGSLKLGKLRYAGKGGFADVSAETCPSWVLGTGSISLDLPGIVIMVR